jgi:2,4-dienoyl-CoA reductase (NADPH2)
MKSLFKKTPRFENLLSPISIGTARLRNHMFKPAAGTKLLKDNDGYVTEKGKRLYEAWGKGGVGLVIVESPCLAGDISIDTLGKYSIEHDKFIPGLADLATGITKHGAIAFLQMYHAGQWHLKELTGLTPLSSSPHPPISEFARVQDLRDLENGPPCRELTIEEIEVIEQKFIDGAERAAKAGFQGVDINAGANHLLASFLSRQWNARTDKYGCESYENRTRIVRNIIEGIKKRNGADFPVMVTINGLENGYGELGQTIEESCEIAKLLEQAGADGFQVRASEAYNRLYYWTEQYYFPEKRDPLPPTLDFSHKGVGAYTPVTSAIKKAVSVPILTPGKWDFDLEFAEQCIKEKKVDIIGIVRGLFADCELPNKLHEGRIEDIAPCTACLTCLTGHQNPVKCRINKFLGGEQEYFSYPAIEKKKKVLIAGAGAAGMEAARVAALRGHDVVLYSKESYLGGLMNMANVIKGNYPEDVQKIVTYFKTQMDKLGVRVVKGEEVDLDVVKREKPDVVILATGALLSDRVLPGSENKILVSDKFLRSSLNVALKVSSPAKLNKMSNLWMPIGKSVIVMGGDIKGLQLAEFLIKKGRKVTIVSEDPPEMWGEGLPNVNNLKLNTWFQEKGIEIYREARYEEILKDGLVITTKKGEKKTLKADSIITVFPLMKNENFYNSLRGKVPEVYAIGASREPKTLIVDAVKEANELASSI